MLEQSGRVKMSREAELSGCQDEQSSRGAASIGWSRVAGEQNSSAGAEKPNSGRSTTLPLFNKDPLSNQFTPCLKQKAGT